MEPSANTDRIGVFGVGQAIQSDLRWIFREQVTSDYGIDAQIEVVDGKNVTGKLIAAQIKSGPSFFKPAPGGWWFYPKVDHLDYWLDHSLPVIVVFYNPESKKSYWESVEPSKLLPIRTGGKKLLIPEQKELAESSKKELATLADGSPYELRIRQLRLALPWINLLTSGRRVLLEAHEWINKTSGRGDLAIVSVNDANEDRMELGNWGLVAKSDRYEDILPRLVPWADVVIHEESYDEADRQEWEAECVHTDKEGYQFESESYEDWHKKFDDVGLRPYSNSFGEVDHWQLELVLNDLGRAFLLVDEFAMSNGSFLTPGD